MHVRHALGHAHKLIVRYAMKPCIVHDSTADL